MIDLTGDDTPELVAEPLSAAEIYEAEEI